MKSKINLQIDAGATLRMLPMAWTEPGTSPLLSLASLHNLEISGGGSIDGQGGGWWPTSAGSGLYMIYFTSCNTVLVQNVTISNAPKQQIVFKSSKGGNITIQNITISAPSSHAATPSHNTDGIDLVGTNCLIQNCDISTGDDNIALGTSSSSVPTADILVTNCLFGDGHGMTIGSNTQGGVSNLTVTNCMFNGTDYGIRMKSDNATSGGAGEGGVAQNLLYYNLWMTNILVSADSDLQLLQRGQLTHRHHSGNGRRRANRFKLVPHLAKYRHQQSYGMDRQRRRGGYDLGTHRDACHQHHIEKYQHYRPGKLQIV